MRLSNAFPLALCIVLAACQGGSPFHSRPAGTNVASGQNAAATTPGGASERYPLNPGDKLHISVWGEEALQQDVVVAPDGTISFPLAGQVSAAGHTTDELRKMLADKLKPFIPDPVVTVMVAEASGNTFYVMGEVNRPGEYHSPQPITVVQALSMAGGLTAFASKGHIKVIHEAAGRTEAIPFDYGAVEKGRKLETNVVLKSGDVVLVPD